jgi:hypothetical protein
MGRQPRSGDIPWLSAHSILNWIGGDTHMLILLIGKSRVSCKFLQAANHQPMMNFSSFPLSSPNRQITSVFTR